MSFPSLPNLLGNPLAVVDVETTGRVGGYHEIIQIAILPLNIDLEIADVHPFYQNLKPNFPERAEKRATRVHGLSLDELIMTAPEQERVVDYLVEWFNGLPLGHGRKLTPVAHNWAFERSFLTPWLGAELFDEIFHFHPRDTMIFALMLNDRASMLGKEMPFPRVGLPNMCQKFGIPLDYAHDALADATATAKLYANLMRAVVS